VRWGSTGIWPDTFSAIELLVLMFCPHVDQSAHPMNNIEQTIDRIFAARRLTRHDQDMLMSMFSRRNLTPTDAALINRVYEALSQGRLRVVD
jgi:hypothetical protein